MVAKGLLGAAFALAVSGCDYYAKPLRPLPQTLQLTTLDGRQLDRAALQGKPWVIRLWVPG